MFGGIQNGRKWPLKKLSEICHLVNGYAFKSALYSNEGFSIIRIANVQKGYIDNSDRAYYPVSFEKEFKDSILQKGDILISLTGNVGRVGVITDKHLPAALNQRVQGLRLRKGIPMSNDFLFCVLNLDEFESLCIENASGSAQLNLSTIWVRDFQIICPPFDKQREFTQFANQADKSKFSDFKSRFIEMFGEIESRKSLGEVASYINGFAFKPSDWSTMGLPIIRIQNLTGTNEAFNYYDGNYPEQVEVNDGDILISWSATLGIYVWDRGKALLNQHIFKVSFDKGYINRDYFIYAVSQKLDEMSTKTHGTTMRHIVKSDFDNTVIPFPSAIEQDRFASIAIQTDKSKYLN